MLTGHFYRDVANVFVDLANQRGGDDNVTCLVVYAGNGQQALIRGETLAQGSAPTLAAAVSRRSRMTASAIGDHPPNASSNHLASLGRSPRDSAPWR